MTTEQLKKDTENRLETIFHIRTSLDDLVEHKRYCIIGESYFLFLPNGFVYLWAKYKKTISIHMTTPESKLVAAETKKSCDWKYVFVIFSLLIFVFGLLNCCCFLETTLHTYNYF